MLLNEINTLCNSLPKTTEKILENYMCNDVIGIVNDYTKFLEHQEVWKDFNKQFVRGFNNYYSNFLHADNLGIDEKQYYEKEYHPYAENKYIRAFGPTHSHQTWYRLQPLKIRQQENYFKERQDFIENALWMLK